VPFVWAGPGIAKGKKTDVTVSLIDMYPTFTELCSLPEPSHHLEGQSIASTLADPDSAKDRTVYLPYVTPGEYALINRDLRYIHYKDGEELYDLTTDPNEWSNLASETNYADKKEQIKKLAPTNFAPAARKLSINRNLFFEGETFHWRIK